MKVTTLTASQKTEIAALRANIAAAAAAVAPMQKAVSDAQAAHDAYLATVAGVVTKSPRPGRRPTLSEDGNFVIL